MKQFAAQKQEANKTLPVITETLAQHPQWMFQQENYIANAIQAAEENPLPVIVQTLLEHPQEIAEPLKIDLFTDEEKAEISVFAGDALLPPFTPPLF